MFAPECKISTWTRLRYLYFRSLQRIVFRVFGPVWADRFDYVFIRLKRIPLLGKLFEIPWVPRFWRYTFPLIRMPPIRVDELVLIQMMKKRHCVAMELKNV